VAVDSPVRIIPYCGAPPDPAVIWTTWRLDPVVLLVLGALFVGICRLMRNDRRRAHMVAFATGWLILALALVSPLCPLSVALFSARASQHVVITMIAAPLVALAFAVASARALPRRRFALARSPLAAAFAFAAVVWFWHAPAPYALTFASVAAYWTMHVTLFASALWVWLRLIDGGSSPIETFVASVFSTVQMGFLGALITLAPHAIYAPHFMTTDVWRLTPLEDQQLGGAIMWVFGCVAFLAVAMGSLHGVLGERPASRAGVAARFGQPV
jgi:putative membrane protein